MADYSKGIIYTIRTDDGLYVGSTCDFKERKNCHKRCIYNENSHHYNYKLYKNIRANDGEYRIELYKSFPCENDIELRQEEERIRIELDANLNMCRAYRSEEEREKQNKELTKLWRENNRDEINAYNKEWYEKNRDKRNANKREWRKKNRDEINARLREKITCECGCDSTRRGITIHRKSKKHLNLMKLLDETQSPV